MIYGYRRRKKPKRPGIGPVLVFAFVVTALSSSFSPKNRSDADGRPTLNALPTSISGSFGDRVMTNISSYVNEDDDFSRIDHGVSRIDPYEPETPAVNTIEFPVTATDLTAYNPGAIASSGSEPELISTPYGTFPESDLHKALQLARLSPELAYEQAASDPAMHYYVHLLRGAGLNRESLPQLTRELESLVGSARSGTQ